MSLSREITHDDAVEILEGKFEEDLEQSRFDDIYTEVEYFENCTAPHPPYPDETGLTVGEMDILLVDYDSKEGVYFELKTNPSDLGYGEDQGLRAKNHYSNTDWDIDFRLVLAKERGEPYDWIL